MEEDECLCPFYCACKVLLGKRSFPEYLKLKEYQDFIREPQKPEQAKSRVGQQSVGVGSEKLKQDNAQSGRDDVLHGEEVSNLGPVEKKFVHLTGLRILESSGTKLLNHATHKIANSDPNIKIKANNNQNQSNHYTNSEEKMDAKAVELSPTRSSTGVYNCRNRSRFHKCPTCGKMFVLLSSLQMHEKEHVLESSNPFECKDCGKLYATSASYERHLKIHPKCLLCGKSMTMKQVENQPEEKSGINNVNVCKKCRASVAPVIVRRKSLEHQPQSNGVVADENEFVHPEEFYNAYSMEGLDESGINRDEEYTKENYEKPETLQTGLAFDDESILFCDYCGAMFDCPDDFIPHYNEHGKVEFECRYCLLPCSDSNEVSVHELTHQQDRKFPCIFCPIRFKTYHQREFHETVHRNEAIACSTCGQAFTHYDRLTVHNQKIHHL